MTDDFMTDDDWLKLFLDYHKQLLLGFAVKVACGNWQDAEEGLNGALRELSTKVVDHFKAVSIEDRTDAKKAILPLLWLRIVSRVLDARGRTRKDEKHLGQPVPVETLDYEPANPDDDSGNVAVEKLEKWIAPKWNLLSKKEKKVIQLTILREPPMTDDEAAKEIGTTPGNVKVTRYRALKKLGRNDHNSF